MRPAPRRAAGLALLLGGLLAVLGIVAAALLGLHGFEPGWAFAACAAATAGAALRSRVTDAAGEGPESGPALSEGGGTGAGDAGHTEADADGGDGDGDGGDAGGPD